MQLAALLRAALAVTPAFIGPAAQAQTVRPPTDRVGSTAPQPALVVEVDPCLELLAVVARLAGHPEYNMEVGTSPYSRAVDGFFADQAGHPAVVRLRHLRAELGISYDAVASYAVHLDWRGGRLEPRLDLGGAQRGRLERRWTADAAADFLPLLRAFVRDTGFTDFMEEQRPYQAVAVERFEALLATGFDTDWFGDFFGAAPGKLATDPAPDPASAAAPELRVVLGLLLGGQNYGVGVDLPSGEQLLRPCLGTWSFDDEGLPLYEPSVLPLLVHELSHSYVNPLIASRLGDFQAAGEVLFPPVRELMARQAYMTWEVVLSETLVRAAVLRYERAHGATARELATLRKDDLAKGFALVPVFEQALGEYEADREAYPTLEAFLGQLLEHADAAAAELERQAALAPQLLAASPALDATGVSSELTELTFEFDRPMVPDSYSVVGGGPSFPEVTGRPGWRDGGRTFVLPVRLAPGTTYSFGLNGPGNLGFRAAEGGHALAPVRVSFSTAD